MIRVKVGNQTVGIGFEHKKISFIGVDIPSSRRTICTLYSINGATVRILSTGVSRCSVSDNFRKQVGRRIAMKNAFKIATFTKGERKVIWDAYFRRGVEVKDDAETVH